MSIEDAYDHIQDQRTNHGVDVPDPTGEVIDLCLRGEMSEIACMHAIWAYNTFEQMQDTSQLKTWISE